PRVRRRDRGRGPDAGAARHRNAGLLGGAHAAPFPRARGSPAVLPRALPGEGPGGGARLRRHAFEPRPAGRGVRGSAMDILTGNPPAGFEPHDRKSPLTEPWEPLYSRKTGGTVILGL